LVSIPPKYIPPCGATGPSYTTVPAGIFTVHYSL